MNDVNGPFTNRDTNAFAMCLCHSGSFFGNFGIKIRILGFPEYRFFFVIWILMFVIWTRTLHLSNYNPKCAHSARTCTSRCWSMQPSIWTPRRSPRRQWSLMLWSRSRSNIKVLVRRFHYASKLSISLNIRIVCEGQTAKWPQGPFGATHSCIGWWTSELTFWS